MWPPDKFKYAEVCMSSHLVDVRDIACSCYVGSSSDWCISRKHCCNCLQVSLGDSVIVTDTVSLGSANGNKEVERENIIRVTEIFMNAKVIFLPEKSSLKAACLHFISPLHLCALHASGSCLLLNALHHVAFCQAGS